MKDENEFWITNITNMNVSLADLNLTVKAYTSVNLMSKHHYYTLEQVQKSVESGSLYKKRDKIFVRNVAPEKQVPMFPKLAETFIPSRTKSMVGVKYEDYEELNISDEQFAADNAEIVELDNIPNKKG